MADNISEKVRRYFRQQEEQYGKVIYLDNFKEITSPAAPPAESSVEKAIHSETRQISMKRHSVEDSWESAESLDVLENKINGCLECPLGKSRTKFVFGTGNPNADILLIGEAPGRDEDLQGEPFVGRAGQLLTKILQAINFEREDVYIANILKCRPPNNRRPEKNEVETCEPYLQKQIELIDPQFILALGLTAIDSLLKKKHRMGDIRGSIMDYRGRKMMVTYHPAALLRNPQWKKKTWEDVQKLRKMYDEYKANKD